MMKKKIIFFTATIFDKRDFQRFGFKIIEKRGYKVEAWDFSPWHKSDYFNNYKSPIPIKFDGRKLFKTRKQIEKQLSNLSTNDIIIDAWEIIKHYPFIQDIIRKKKIPFGYIFLGLIPETKPISNAKSTLMSKNENSIKKKKVIYTIYQNLVRVGSFFKSNIMNKYDPKVNPTFIICGGKKANKSYSGFNNINIDVIKTHALDYDRYLEQESKDENVGIDSNYAIFLDEDVPFHPDYLYHGIEPDCDPENYYAELNRFFQSFEKSFGFPVLIAAHPRANYSIRDNPFNGRKIIIGQTIPYVKHSTIVLSHMSTAKNFAILYAKPIIYLDSNRYSLRYRESILGHANALGESPVNISNDLDLTMINDQIDDRMYESYKDTYIKEPGTPEKPIWDIFCDYLNTHA